MDHGTAQASADICDIGSASSELTPIAYHLFCLILLQAQEPMELSAKTH
jgi:hypothetical protein